MIKNAFLSPEEQNELEGEIETLEKNVELLETEITRRGEEKDK